MKKGLINIIVLMLLFSSIFNLFILKTENINGIGLHETDDGSTYGVLLNHTILEDGDDFAFTVTNDTWIENMYIPDSSMWNDDTFDIFYDVYDSWTTRGLLKMNVTFDIPSDATITNAQLRLKTNSVIPSGSTLYVYRITEQWEQETVSWNNQPSIAGSPTDFQTMSSHTIHYFNVTSDVQGFIDGSYNNYGWELRVQESTSDKTIYVYQKESSGQPKPYLFGSYETRFNITRTTSSSSEINNCSFNPIVNWSENITLKIPVSSDVQGIISVHNNTDNVDAVEVDTLDELVNNSFWYDASNQFVYIGTCNITIGTLVNWSVNCSYGVVFNLIIPPFLTVGQYFMAEGFIEDGDGEAISGMIATTRLLYQNGSDALPVNPKHNCTGGNYNCKFSTAILPPGIYSVSIEFVDPATGITYKEGSTLYLSWSPESGIYSDAVMHVRWYNTNLGLGLPDETLKLYVDNILQYNLDYYTYIGATINVTVKDFYDSVLFTDDITINITHYPLPLGLTYHEYDFSNSNDEWYVASFLKQGASRWFELIVPAYGHEEFLLPTGNYTIRIYNSDNSTYVIWNETVNASRGFLIAGDNITQVIEGLSRVEGQILQFRHTMDYVLMPNMNIVSQNVPMPVFIFEQLGVPLLDGIKLCPPLVTKWSADNETYGNWINSTPLIPTNDTIYTGTVVIYDDIIHMSGNASWVNITYTGNGSLIQNTSYVPYKLVLNGENITINASNDIQVYRETVFLKYRKFNWTYYNHNGWGPIPSRTGWHTAGIPIYNTLNISFRNVMVICVLAEDTTCDPKTVRVQDVDNNGNLLEGGVKFDVLGNSIQFIVPEMEPNSIRTFNLDYYKETSESYYYGEDRKSISDYDETVFEGKSYNSFEFEWNNPRSQTFRGGLYVKLDFKKPKQVDIDDESIIIKDLDSNSEIDSKNYVVGTNFIRIDSEAVGDVGPGGMRSFRVYFLFKNYPGGSSKEWNVNTIIWEPFGFPITFAFIMLILGAIILCIGVFLIWWIKSVDKKKTGILIVCVGVFIVFIFFVLSTIGA